MSGLAQACIAFAQLNTWVDTGVHSLRAADCGGHVGTHIVHRASHLLSQLRCPGIAPGLQVCTVFAQLTVGGKWEGPHVFVVRLRDDSGQLTPGVRIRDNGPKAGLNGVDNGQIWWVPWICRFCHTFPAFKVEGPRI